MHGANGLKGSGKSHDYVESKVVGPAKSQVSTLAENDRDASDASALQFLVMVKQACLLSGLCLWFSGFSDRT